VLRTEELEETILEQLREGKPLKSICKAPGMPRESTVRTWASEDGPFAERYQRARQLGYEKMADELVAISDQTGDPQRDRLRVDTRKWLLSKALSKIYGDRLEVENKGGIMIVRLDAEDMKA
jgi:terminase small subunit-like protein